MSHPRKKHGQRKDKKNERMREDVAFRQAMAHEKHESTDQADIVNYKPGGADDFNRHQSGKNQL